MQHKPTVCPCSDRAELQEVILLFFFSFLDSEHPSYNDCASRDSTTRDFHDYDSRTRHVTTICIRLVYLKSIHDCTRGFNIPGSCVALCVPSLLSSPRYAHCVQGVESLTAVQYHKPHSASTISPTKWGKEAQKEGTSPRSSKLTAIAQSLSHTLCLCHILSVTYSLSDTLCLCHILSVTQSLSHTLCHSSHEPHNLRTPWRQSCGAQKITKVNIVRSYEMMVGKKDMKQERDEAGKR